MLTNINLIETINDQVTRTRIPSATRTPTFYPSEASIMMPHGRIDGGCHRKTFYRISGLQRTNPAGQLLCWRGLLGKEAENLVVKALTQSGMYESRGTKFYDPELNLSGELDIVAKGVTNDGTPFYYGIEVKSIYGNWAVNNHIKGRRRWRGQPPIVPHPKLAHLMQTMLYVWYFREQLAGFKLLYIARDTGEQREYNIKLRQFLTEDGTVKHCAEVDGTPDRTIVLEDIHDRYRALRAKLVEATTSGVPPDREFQLRYDNETMATLREQEVGSDYRVGDAKHEKWERGEDIGDWQCGYCDFKQLCYA